MLVCGYRGSSSPGCLLLHVCVFTCPCPSVRVVSLALLTLCLSSTGCLQLQIWSMLPGGDLSPISRGGCREHQLILLGEVTAAWHTALLRLLWPTRQAHQMSGAWLQVNNSWCAGQDKILCISVMGLGCLHALAWEEKEAAHLSERHGCKSEDLG